MAKRTKIDRDLSKWINGLSDEQMAKIYEVIDGPVPQEIREMTDDELLKGLSE
jgi:hypothetical protein